MTINWFGQSFFKITIKNEQGDDVIIAIDPYSNVYGLKPPSKFGADIVLVTHDHPDHNNLNIIKGTNLSPKPFIISGPGEYEIKGVMIYGIQLWCVNTIYFNRNRSVYFWISPKTQIKE